MSAHDTAASAIARLRMVRDAVEFAARPPGDFVTMDRQTADAIIDDVGVAARLIREMEEARRVAKS